MSQFKAREYLKNSNIDFFTSLIKEGKFINITKSITIFSDKKNKDGSFNDIFLEDTRNDNPRMIYAKKGLLVNDGLKKKFKLTNGKIVNYKGSDINVFEFDQIDFGLNDLDTKTITSPKIQEIDTITLLGCISDGVIKKIVKTYECLLHQEIKRELFKRIYKPVFIPIIALIAGFLIISAKNKINYRKYNFAIFIISILLLIFSEASVRYISSSTLITILCLVMPIIIFFVSYLIFYRAAKYV